MPTRSSARLKAKNDTQNSNLVLSESSAALPVKSRKRVDGPARKRLKAEADSSTQKPEKAPNSRRRGKLKEITEMPLDVLYEMFSHLEPADLLHLSQANKCLRQFLVTRSAIAVWKSVRTLGWTDVMTLRKRPFTGVPECRSTATSLPQFYEHCTIYKFALWSLLPGPFEPFCGSPTD